MKVINKPTAKKADEEEAGEEQKTAAKKIDKNSVAIN